MQDSLDARFSGFGAVNMRQGNGLGVSSIIDKKLEFWVANLMF